jgi:hypothetical protein
VLSDAGFTIAVSACRRPRVLGEKRGRTRGPAANTRAPAKHRFWIGK